MPLMLAILFKPLTLIWRMLKTHDTPWQLAGGCAIGSVIGLVPKDNLIAGALCVLLCSVRVNKSAGALAAFAFVWLGTVVDPAAEVLGHKLLGVEALQGLYAALFDMPLGPWIGFHNTVVLGSLLLGAYFALPVYWLTYLVCQAIQRHWAERLRRNDVDRLVADMKLGAPWEAAA
jgi:uncharacterized protein (TIGR03546 family)